MILPLQVTNMVFSYPYRSIMLFRCAQSIQGKRTRDLRKTNTLSSRIGRKYSHNTEVTHFELPHIYAILQDPNYFDQRYCFQLGLFPVQPPNDSLNMTSIQSYHSYRELSSGLYLSSPCHHRYLKHTVYLTTSPSTCLLWLHFTTWPNTCTTRLDIALITEPRADLMHALSRVDHSLLCLGSSNKALQIEG